MGEDDECRPVEVDHVLRVFDRCGGREPWSAAYKVKSVVKNGGRKLWRLSRIWWTGTTRRS